jgi:uncharacterized protein involved in outer membrane biogenesis
MSNPAKLAWRLLLTLLAILILAGAALPLLVPIDGYRSEIAAYLSRVTGRPFSLGRLSLHAFPRLSVRVEDLSIANAPGFPAGDFLSTRRLSLYLDGFALLRRQILVKALELDRPAINLVAGRNGRWNYDGAAVRAVPAKVSPPGSSYTRHITVSFASVLEIVIDDGQLTAAETQPSGELGRASLSVSGISLKLKPVSLDPLLHSPDSRQDARAFIGTGSLKARAVESGGMVATNVTARLELLASQITADQLTFDFYGGHGTGSAVALPAINGQTGWRYATDLQLNGVNMAALLQPFPRARDKLTGTMECRLKLNAEPVDSSDPLAGKQGSGEIRIRDGRLPTLQLSRNLLSLARAVAVGPAAGDPASFSVLSADLNISGSTLTSDRVQLKGNGVDLTARGRLRLADPDPLDYQGEAGISAKQNALTQLIAGLSGAHFENGELRFAFRLEGSVEHPRFGLGNSSSTPGTADAPMPQDTTNTIEAIEGLFKKKGRR